MQTFKLLLKILLTSAVKIEKKVQRWKLATNYTKSWKKNNHTHHYDSMDE